MKQALLAAGIVLGALSPADAMTGDELRQYCEDRWDLCHGFIVGAAGMFWYQMQIDNPVCFGEGLTWEQVHDVVVNYLEERPEAGQEHALVVVTWAMREAFDCASAQERPTRRQKDAVAGRYGSAVGVLPPGP